MMRVGIALLGLWLVMGCTQELAPEQRQAQQQWLAWQQQNNNEAADPQTSFLNIRDAAYLNEGDSVWLDSRVSPAQIRWRTANENTDLGLTHAGGHAEVVWYHSQHQLSHGQTLPLNDRLFITVGDLYQGKMRAFIRDNQHPLLAEFSGFEFYPYNPDAKVEASFVATAVTPVKFQTVQGLVNQFYRVGLLNFAWQGQQLTMAAYHHKAQPPYDSLMLFFKDQTNGDGTYGGGRELYLEFADGIPATLWVDFNFSVNFYCARSTFWNCPVLREPPLTVAIDAGERYSPKS